MARPVRLVVAAFGVSVGLMLGGPLADAPGGAAAAVLVAGLVVEVVVVLVWLVALARGERRFRAAVVEATSEIERGEVEPVPAVGRVVRRRVVDLPSWVPGGGRGTGRAALTVLTAVGDGPPRRVAALVPVELDLHGKDVPALLLLHPTRRDAAVLDDRVTTERLREVDTDPRWLGEPLPTDRSVVGGYRGLLVALVGGGVTGALVSVLVVSLAT